MTKNIRAYLQKAFEFNVGMIRLLLQGVQSPYDYI